MGIYTDGNRSRHKLVIEVLDAVSRKRALTLQESLDLEWAIDRERLVAEINRSDETEIPFPRDQQNWDAR